MYEITRKGKSYKIVLSSNVLNNKLKEVNYNILNCGQARPKIYRSTFNIEYSEGRYICCYSLFSMGIYVNAGEPHIDKTNEKHFRTTYNFELSLVGIVYIPEEYVGFAIDYLGENIEYIETKLPVKTGTILKELFA